MATFTQAQAQAAVDNLGQMMVDAATALPTSTEVTTVSTDMSTEVTRIQALSDTLVQSILLSAYTNEQRTTALGGAGSSVTTGRLLNWLTTVELWSTAIQNGPFGICDALEFICSEVGSNTGLANFLYNNSTLVDVYTADIFNQFASAVASGSYIRKYGTTIPAKIPSASVFPHTNVDYINTFTTTSTTAGTLTTGTAALAALAGGGVTVPGGGTLEAYAGDTIQAASYTITVTYTNMAGVTGQTVTFAIVGGTTQPNVFTPGASVQAASIQSVAITTGTATGAGDIVRFRLKPERVIAA